MTAKPSAAIQSSLIESRVKVAVLMGGIGEERDISIQSGSCVAQALKEAGLDVVTSDVGPDNLDILEDSSIDVFFLALHGRFGEDGQLQQILEDKSLRYTGSRPRACRLALDKMASKKAFSKAGILTPVAIEFNSNADPAKLEKQLEQFADRFVVKPVTQGSSIGMSVANNSREAIAAASDCFSEFGDCMIEELIPGRDITVGILCDQALPIIELRTQSGFYDYHSKYFDEQTEFLFDTIDNPALTAKIKTAALDCFNALGCRHFARVDFRLNNDDDAYALELNAIPGFTSRSDLPKAAAKTGLSMNDLCIKIIEAALRRHSFGASATLENRKTKHPSKDPAKREPK
ncbi:MAG: D-alanine--D-alanine ligase [Sedimentisphaerales bacterium]